MTSLFWGWELTVPRLSQKGFGPVLYSRDLNISPRAPTTKAASFLPMLSLFQYEYLVSRAEDRLPNNLLDGVSRVETYSVPSVPVTSSSIGADKFKLVTTKYLRILFIFRFPTPVSLARLASLRSASIPD